MGEDSRRPRAFLYLWRLVEEDMASEDTTEYKVASAPFNTDFADFTLRTPDKVDFWVHSQVLRLTSTVFDAIVSIPQPATPSGIQSSSRPVIDMTEDSTTLDCVLRCCYPTDEPKSTDIELLDRVLTAAHKYEFERATAWAKRVLDQLIGTKALSVYTLACVHNLEELATKAATAWKQSKASWNDKSQTFEETPAGASYSPFMAERLRAGPYLQLMQYLRGHSISTFCSPIDSSSSPSTVVDLLASTVSRYPFNSATADIVFRSVEGHDFRVHALIIEQHLRKPGLDEGQTLSIWTAFGCSRDDLVLYGLPVVRTNIRWDALSTLLKLCYPMPIEHDISCWTIEKATSVAAVGALLASVPHFQLIFHRYYIRLSHLVTIDPFSVYCICVRFGKASLAAIAVRELAQRRPEALYSDSMHLMNLLPAKDYYTLLKHYHTCQGQVYLYYRSKSLLGPGAAVVVNDEVSNDLGNFTRRPFPVTVAGLTQDEAFGGVLFSKATLGQATVEIDHVLSLGRAITYYKINPDARLRANEVFNEELMSVIDRQWVKLRLQSYMTSDTQ